MNKSRFITRWMNPDSFVAHKTAVWFQKTPLGYSTRLLVNLNSVLIFNGVLSEEVKLDVVGGDHLNILTLHHT